MALGKRPIDRAAVIGSGPNGLAAAIRLAEAGVSVDVFEAQQTPGGGARTMDLTLPGFHHDFGSAVHPLGVASPFFRRLPLERFGLEWIYSPAVLAHPLDGGRVAMLEQDLGTLEALIGDDGRRWRRWMAPFVANWDALADEVLGPISFLPRHPFLMARFGLSAFAPASITAGRLFRGEAARAIFAGIAAHSFLALDEPLSSAVGVMLAVAAHVYGWPIPKGGSQAITSALVAHLASLGGTVHSSHPISSLDDLARYDAVLCDLTPRQLMTITGDRAAGTWKEYRYGAGVYKVDYALSEPIPLAAPECSRAATVHLGGTFEEVAASEKAMRTGTPAERPFILVAQSSLFDSTRAPAGKHTAWMYCHVPNGSTFDMLERMELQVERFAPGFRDCVLARHVLTPGRLESLDGNLVGGDINGGAYDLGSFLRRSSRRAYRTGIPGAYLCSSSTPPAGGVHGMCGFHAAEFALRGE
jgi:phytoene dehydrogenase-like protein